MQQATWHHLCRQAPTQGYRGKVEARDFSQRDEVDMFLECVHHTRLICACMYVYIYICMCIHIYIYTHIHNHRDTGANVKYPVGHEVDRIVHPEYLWVGRGMGWYELQLSRRCDSTHPGLSKAVAQKPRCVLIHATRRPKNPQGIEMTLALPTRGHV